MNDQYVLSDEQLAMLLGRNRRQQIIIAIWTPLILVALVFTFAYLKIENSDAKRCTEHVREIGTQRAFDREWGSPLTPPAGASAETIRSYANGNAQRAAKAEQLLRQLDQAAAC